jgi:UDP-N-acetylmuramate dehydrogenase
MDIQKVYSQLISQFPEIEIHQNHPLTPYTTVKIGGPADIFIHTKTSKDFLEILKAVSILNTKYLIPNTILGNGSNVLISDTGIRGIVIKNSSNEIEILANNQVKVASGVQLSQLINFSLDHNLVGLEEFAYIPSSIGGAVFGNIHGFDKHDFNQFLDSIEVFDLNTKQLISYSTSQLKWSYDYSSLQDQPNLIIVSATINLQNGDTKIAKQKYQEIIQKKSPSQPMKSLGCVFKNPPESVCLPIWGEKKGAGWIIDNELKLKGHSIGDAQISPLHANFIVNNGQSTATDYLALITLVQSQMQAKFNFQFELEIRLLGEF